MVINMKETETKGSIFSLGAGIIIAFAMYSKIPMPHISWKEKNMRYAICAFPLVGMVIGLLFLLWNRLCMISAVPVEITETGIGSILQNRIPEWTRICFGAAIPLIITGGIHVDGFMDTCDALHSYQEKERKLEILKDPHIGAFSVIMLLLASLIGLGSLGMIQSEKQIMLMSLVFVLGRILSGLSVVTFPNAKREGTLYTFSSLAHKRTVRVILALELLLCMTGLLLIDWKIGGTMILVSGCLFLYYWYRSKTSFGGITGDLAGWFLCLCEILNCLVIGIVGMLLR